MMSLTSLALRNRTLVALLTVLVVVLGPISFLSHPSREDPEIVNRTVLAESSFDGMSPERVENLITRKIEEKIREIAEVEHITSTSRNSSSITKVIVYDRYKDMDPIWRELRDKMEEIKRDLPEGTQGPNVNDDYGAVAMATIAVTAEGFSLAEMRRAARWLRNQLYTTPGVKKIEIFGIEPERIYVEFDNVRLARFGIAPGALVEAIQKQNIVLPGGRVEALGETLVIEPSGNFESLDEVGGVSINIPGKIGQLVYLRDIAKIHRGYVDPPKNPAYFNGQKAVVLSLSMLDQYDAFQFGEDIDQKQRTLEAELPIGFKLDYITFQPNEINTAVFGVLNNLWQTVIIVLAVVVLFLGWRLGLIVGAMVPLVMLLAILIMRQIGIELERMSLATLIIALGLLVDNGIVIAEEISRRLGRGEERLSAAIAAGNEMAVPLLSSSLTTIFAFLPLMLADSAAGEYTRSISLVIAITLLGSWVMAVTATPLFCYWFAKAPAMVSAERQYDSKFFHLYRRLLSRVIQWRWLTIAGTLLVLALALWSFQFVPKVFFPASERTQMQIQVDLPVGANSYATGAVADQLMAWLNNKEINPEVVSHVAYIASGGPRFYLSLSPIDPDPNRAYFIVNLATAKDVGRLIARTRAFALRQLPEARVLPKPLSLGPGEAGLVTYRIVGPNEDELKTASEALQRAMRAIPFSRNVKDDWENPMVKVVVEIDQARARRAGATSEDIANALNAALAGAEVTGYREGDLTIPVVLRESGEARQNIDRLRTLNLANVEGSAVPLLQIANFRGEREFARIQRRDLERTLSVSGLNATLSAVAFDAALAPALEAVKATLPPSYRIEKGGELEDSAKAQASLAANFPFALIMILLVLVAQFDSIARPLIILLTIPLVMIGVSLVLNIAPGANFGFMAMLGLLSLAGIVINNAIVLIDKIEIERTTAATVAEAIINASVARLRPILMTTGTTALGLAPIILSRDILFYDLALVIAGGMVVGTVLTLVVVPALYAIFFGSQRGTAS